LQLPKGDNMSDYRVGVVVGSLHRDSFNRHLAEAIVKLAPREFSLRQLQINDLPLYNQDDDATPAEPVRRLKAEITESDGILFVTPRIQPLHAGPPQECARSCPRPYGQSPWTGKPAGVIGASPSCIGTSLAQPHPRTSLAYLGMPTGAAESLRSGKRRVV
jgi:chromate reductase